MFPSKSSGDSSPNQGKMYQIDFTAVASGKRIASSKRRVRWRFGFANLDALEAGQTGTECRGEEHDVTIVWSITSGKRLVLADGKEVHFSHSRHNIFDFSWTMRGNHVLKIVAHAQPPLSAQPGFRQYDFFVDGQSFFTFPKVFRLGLAPSDPRGGRSNSRGGSSSLNQSQQNMETTGRRVVPSEYNNYEASGGGGQSLVPYVTGGGGGGGGRSVNSNNIVSIEAPHNTEEEDAYLRQAIENSLKEDPSPNRASVTSSVGGSAPPASETDTLLLDFMTPPTSAAPSGPADPALALPPSTSLYASDMFGQQPAFAALPPSTTTTATSIASNTTSTNAPFPPEQQQQQQQQQQLDPWGMASVAAALPPSQPPITQEYDVTHGGGPPHVPTPVSNPFGGAAALTVPETNLSFGSPPPTSITGPSQEEFTPATLASSIGFASPMMAQTLGAQGQQQQQQQQLGVTGIFEQHEPDQQHQSTEAGAGAGASNAEVAAAPHSDPALLSMNVLSGQSQSLVTESMINGGAGQAAGSSMADQAYAKLVNMDAFDLVQDKDTESRQNPFDVESTTSTTIGGGNNNKNASLADMMMSKKPTEKKEVMKNHAGALVLSNSQQGNFGGYGVQHQQPQQMQGYGSLQQQNNYSQPPLQQYGQQQAYGGIQQQTAPAPPPMQQQYEQPPLMQQQQQQPYGQPVPMQQQQQQQHPYGQPVPMQQQQTYGQPAPTSQQPFGF